jgi:hypothetical protein
LKNCRKLSTGQKNMKPLRLITISSFPSTWNFSKKYTHFSYANLLIFSVYGTSTLALTQNSLMGEYSKSIHRFYHSIVSWRKASTKAALGPFVECEDQSYTDMNSFFQLEERLGGDWCSGVFDCTACMEPLRPDTRHVSNMKLEGIKSEWIEELVELSAPSTQTVGCVRPGNNIRCLWAWEQPRSDKAA